jgi:hypothetical protein
MARRIVLAVALCALAASVTPAVAHEGNPNYESLVRGVTPPIASFAVVVLNGDDRLEVRNAGPRTVTIEGYDEEPYLRLSPGGRVEVNVRSPAYYLNQERFTGAPVPDSADAKAVPRWKVVARTGRYEFHDHRMHWMAKSVPEQVRDRSQRTKIFDWNVPLHVGAATGAIRGELFWRGSDGGAPVGAVGALGALVLLGGAAVVIVRRRRRGAAGRSGDATTATAREEAW